MTKDQLVTTHPILAEVPNVRAAAYIFDGITYGKGFAALRQLDYYLGGTAFRDGCRHYFKTYPWKNTTLDDFIGSLEKASGQNLKGWVKQWLATSDINTIELDYKAKDGAMADVVIQQYSGRSNDVLRRHAANLGLFYGDNGKPDRVETLRIEYSGAQTRLKLLEDKKAPLLILPNYSDEDYVKVRLDSKSLDWVLANMNGIPNSTTRLTLWRILWDMIRDSHLSARVYYDLVIESAPLESEVSIVSRILGRANNVVETCIPDPKEKETLRKQLLTLARQQVEKQKAGSDLQQNWYYAAISATRPDELQLLVDLLEGRKSYPGLDLTQARKWDLLRILTQYGHERAAELTQSIGGDDQSSLAARTRLYMQAARPDRQAKDEAWQRVTRGEDSLRDTFQIAAGIYTEDRWTEPFIDRFFTDLPEIWKGREYVFASRFVYILFPHRGREQTLKAAQAFLKRDDLDGTLRNLLLEEVDNLQRVLAMRAAWSGKKAAGDRRKTSR